MNKKFLLGSLGTIALGSVLYAADHGDTPQLIEIGRHDARITDWHGWRNGDNLVMSLCTNPNIPTSATSYRFPEDLTLRMHIDNHSAVDFSNAELTAKYGGVVVDPSKISDDITLEFSFDQNGSPVMFATGLTDTQRSHIQTFAGLRDDPFINGLRNGRNVACVVVELPLADVQGSGSTLLTWGTSKVPDLHQNIVEHGGRALRSQFPENMALNSVRPRAQYTELGQAPDVMIMNLNAASGFPNGRLLTDDVIDLVGDVRLTGNPTAQAPTANDKPFLAAFPYLAAPF